MIHIPLKANPPSDRWLEKARQKTAELKRAKNKAKKHKIIDDNSRIWGQIKKHLLSLSHGKCWYSEAKESYSHYHVEHFRPKKQALDLKGKDKGGYWWLAFEWTNYRICGSVGNCKKCDRFHVRSGKARKATDPLDDEVYAFLDPADEDDPGLLTFDETGQVKPANSDDHAWDNVRAQYTIKYLDLTTQSRNIPTTWLPRHLN